MLKRLRPQHLRILEAGLIGLFFVQALRLLIGALYSRTASAALTGVLGSDALDSSLPGIVSPEAISGELSFMVYLLVLPLLGVIRGRNRWLMLIAIIITAVGRALMSMDTAVADTVTSATVIAGGLLYITTVIRQRAQLMPYIFVLGFAADQVLRALGNTLDPSLAAAYATPQLILSALAIILGIITITRQPSDPDETVVSPDFGLMPIWGGISLGALLFLEITLLALPNAITARAQVDYTLFVPLVLAATLLPVVPGVRSQMRNFMSIFDGSMRGWLWMLLSALLLICGLRFQGIGAGVALVLMQFAISLMWWWVLRPQVEKERNFSGVWLALGLIIMALLLTGDIFTYEYAFVRDLASGSQVLDTFVPAMLRGFRGMGLGLLLLAVFLAALPMTQTQRRIPWGGSASLRLNILALLVTLLASGAAAYAARPPVISGVRNQDIIRLGTYNIHAGYNEFFHYDLEAIAQTIETSGANVVLLQEVEAGRSTSFGVDQTLWLARRLKMDRRFYATNEGLQGLAVLSNIEITGHEGYALTSTGQQTGLQYVRLRPDSGEMSVYNTWLGLLLAEPGSDALEQEEQDQQQQLLEIFGILTANHPGGSFGRLVLGGTFNNTPTSPLIQQTRDAGFRDPFAGQPVLRSFTLQRTAQEARIDYLWLRPPLQEISAGVLENRPSDHRMAVIELQVATRTN